MWLIDIVGRDSLRSHSEMTDIWIAGYHLMVLRLVRDLRGGTARGDTGCIGSRSLPPVLAVPLSLFRLPGPPPGNTTR